MHQYSGTIGYLNAIGYGLVPFVACPDVTFVSFDQSFPEELVLDHYTI